MSQLSVCVLETRRAEAEIDPVRTIALAYGSRLILERLGAWDALRGVTPVHKIVVSQQGRFGRAGIDCAELGVPALGYVTPYAALCGALSQALDASGAEVVRGSTAAALQNEGDYVRVTFEQSAAMHTLAARLAVVADGGAIAAAVPATQRDYGQTAVACPVLTAMPHENRALERFTPEGPLALLPSANGWSLVWTLPHARAAAVMQLDDAAFCAQLEAAFGPSLGAFTHAGARSAYPLQLRYAGRPVAPRTVLIGNAAQTLHPVAAQGFNLGLRDAWELSRLLTARPGELDSSALLERYAERRRVDRRGAIGFTDALIRLFCNDIPLLREGRGAGLALFDMLAPAKDLLARRMMFGARG